MNTLSEETPEDGKQRRKSIGTPSSLVKSSCGSSGSGGLKLAGGKTRRYSIGITSSRKSIGEEGNLVPNYLRASTGSCHDFCKYGKKHEHSKSSIPIKFKRSTAVNKEKVTKTDDSVERKKTTPVAKLKALTDPKTRNTTASVEVTKTNTLLPSKKTQALKQSFSTNGKAKENEVKIVQRSSINMKPSQVVVNSSSLSNGGVKKKEVKTVKKFGVTSKISPESNSKPSFTRAASLKSIKHKSIKQVSPLKDQNRMQKTELKKTTNDKIQTKNMPGVESESEIKPETTEFDFSHQTIESMEPMESFNNLVSDGFELSSERNVLLKEEELMITNPESEILEESSIAPPVVESSSSDKEVFEEDSLIAPPVSESSQSFYDDEVLEDEEEDEDEDEFTDEEEVEVFEEDSDNEKAFASDTNDNKMARKGRMVISEEKDPKAVKLRFRRGKILEVKSENNGPRRLKFRRRVIEGKEDEVNDSTRIKFVKGKVMEENGDGKRIVRRSYEKKYAEEVKDGGNNGPESVVLKHQGEQGKKDAQGLFNNVIEETASKLVESRKSKVKALVGAFETVISLQDGRPSSS